LGHEKGEKKSLSWGGGIFLDVGGRGPIKLLKRGGERKSRMTKGEDLKGTQKKDQNS